MGMLPVAGLNINVIIFLVVYDQGWHNYLLFALIPTFLFLIAYPLYALFNTCYELKGGLLYCKSGVLRRKIPIKDIAIVYTDVVLDVVVIHWDFPVTQIQPALHNEGIIIKYGKYDYGFISPKEEKQLIEYLLEENPLIELKKWKKKS